MMIPTDFDSLQRLVQKYNELKQKTSWQPIETAPKDRTKILLNIPDDSDGTKGAIVIARWNKLENEFTYAGYAFDTATHWMPLPEPPK